MWSLLCWVKAADSTKEGFTWSRAFNFRLLGTGVVSGEHLIESVWDYVLEVMVVFLLCAIWKERGKR